MMKARRLYYSNWWGSTGSVVNRRLREITELQGGSGGLCLGQLVSGLSVKELGNSFQ